MRLHRYTALLAAHHHERAKELDGEGDWRRIAEEITPSDFSGNPWELVRALSEDVEEYRQGLKRELKARYDGIARYGDASVHRGAIEKLKQELDEVDDLSLTLFSAANPAAVNGPKNEFEPQRCKVRGCITEIKDGRESDRTGGRCPEHWAQARGAVEPQKRGRVASLTETVRAALENIGKGDLL